jgi:hypothetical protein
MIAGRPDIRLRDVSLFFFPLMLNVQLMSVSHSIINAGLARQEDFIVALAGFSVAMVLHLFLASPSYQNHTVTIAMVRGRKSLKRVLFFAFLVGSYVSIMLALVAFTPFGSFLLGSVLGINQQIATEARSVLSILVLLPFATGLRGIAQGLIIQARRTEMVSLATGIRIAALIAALFLARDHFTGARLGAVALLTCVTVETIIISLIAWRLRIRHQNESEKSLREIIAYAFPLAYSSCLQQTIPLLINAIISRLPDGPQALAAFGVIRGLLFLLAGPLRNLQQAYLTLVVSHADNRVLLQFFRRVSGGMALLMILIVWPLNELVLGKIMGLNDEMRSYIIVPLLLCALYPILYGASNLLRGVFAGAHKTSRLGTSTIWKSIYMLACWGVLTLFPPPLDGIFVAIALLLTAEAIEVIYLKRQKRTLQLNQRLT